MVRWGPAEKWIWVCLAHVPRFLMLPGLTIVWAIPISNASSAEEEIIPLYVFAFVRHQELNKYAKSLVFLRGSADGNDVCASNLCCNKMISGNASVFVKKKQSMNAYLQVNARSFGLGPKNRCRSVDRCAKANVTGGKGGDGFLHGTHECDGILDLLLFFLSAGKPMMTDFSAPPFFW